MATIRKINVSQVQGHNPFYGETEAVLPSGTLVMYEDNSGEFILRVHDGVTEGGNGLKLDQTTSMNGGAVLDSTDGNFEVRGVTNINAEASGVVNIYTDVQGTGYQWQFGDDGVLTVPASSGITGLNSITVPLNEALTVNLSTQLGLDPLTQSSISIRPSELKSSNFYIGLSTVNNHSIDLLEDEKQVNIGVISSGEFIRIRYGTATPGGLANGSAQIDAGNWGAGLESSVYLTAQNNTWQFRGQDSAIVFPDTTVQTTAYAPVTGSWTVTPGTATYSFTVDWNRTYLMWVRGNIPNGIIAWNATATVTNANVPVIGQQFAWNYTGGGTPLSFVSIPSQIIGTPGTISTDATSFSTANTFEFSISNTTGTDQTVTYGYIKL